MSRDYAKILDDASSVMMSNSLKSRHSTKQPVALRFMIFNGSLQVASFSRVTSFRKTAHRIEVRCSVIEDVKLFRTLNSLSKYGPLILSYGEEEFNVQSCEEWATTSEANSNDCGIELIFNLAESLKSKEILNG